MGLKAWDWIFAGIVLGIVGFDEGQYFGTGTEGGWLSGVGFVYAGRVLKMKFLF